MTTLLDTRARGLAPLRAAGSVLAGLLVIGLFSGCARNSDEVPGRRETSGAQIRQAPAPTESAASRVLSPAAVSPAGSAGAAAPGATSATSPTPVNADARIAGATSRAAGGPESASPVMKGAGSGGPVAFPRPEDVPLAPMGDKIGYSPVTKSPGYYAGDDPEADAVRTGRRKAPVIDIPFTGGMGSAEELALYILDALRKNDSRALEAIRVTPDEFTRIMWPEFPQSRPYCNSTAEFAFFFLDRTSHQGVGLGMTTWGGKDLRLDGISYTGGRSVYTNFTLFNGVELQVSDPDGQAGVVRFAQCFAERKGSWKVYTYKDKE
jgi:hypothetical protein